MNLIMSLYVALLFVLLTPGVLIKLPPKGSLLTVAIVHGLVFALVFHLTCRAVYKVSMEGFRDKGMKTCPDGAIVAENKPCPPPREMKTCPDNTIISKDKPCPEPRRDMD